MVVEQLHRSYFGEALLPVASYAGFVRYSRGIDLDVAGEYWTSSLSGATGNIWPPVPRADVPYRGVKRFLERSITLDASNHASVTLATVATAAWGLALSKLNDTNDVCFMMTSSGRQAPLQALESVPGITTARVPVRVRVEDNQTVSEFLRAVQDYVVNSVPHEHYGVANMADLMPELGPSLVAPTSQVAMQPAKIHDAASNDADDPGAIMTAPAPDVYSSAEAIDGFHVTPLVTDCFIGDARVDISSTYNCEVLAAEELGSFYDRVERNIRFLWGHSRESVALMN
ncbi:hypothetical protein N3K66_008328 [Trichothecium roseum]|uniref:Uncharacterized protein n=1 Tax=Trichothecium roseum TaxID=47278 RepID=A0ACC0UT88_9HYPO|nr:hypothetical protein N3K66_008328 [Trichothecium roseum]